MLALITARCWEEHFHSVLPDEERGEWHEYYIVKEDCETFEEAGRYIDSVFGREADTVKIEFIDAGAIYLNKEILDKLKSDEDYMSDSYHIRIDPNSPI